MKFPISISLLVLFTSFSAIAEKDIVVNSNLDPLEAINRPIFAFNDGIDRLLLRPIAVGYETVTPSFVQRGIGNIFSNTADFTTSLNSVLQGKFDKAGSSSGRFLINSTLGLLGLFDVASVMGLEGGRSDFGHTLSFWGVSSGPYLVIPLFGPRTVRSGAGTIFDSLSSVEKQIDNVQLRNSILGLKIVDSRAELLKADDLITGDRYIFVRDAYLQRRKALESGDEVIDDFEYETDEDF